MVTYLLQLGNDIVAGLNVKGVIDSNIDKIAEDFKREVQYFQEHFGNVGRSFMDQGNTTEKLVFCRLVDYSYKFLYKVSPEEYQKACEVIEKSGYKGDNKVFLNMSIMLYILDKAIGEGKFDSGMEEYIGKVMEAAGSSN